MNNRRLNLAVLILLTCAAPTLAQRGLEDIPDPDPQKQLESFQVADGFEVNLFASDPMVRKPIQMNWDAEGRLWVATSTSYPQIQPGEEANDKIIVLEDTDGDGQADKSTVFAEGLLIPTAVIPDDTPGMGAYVANSTELLHMRDTDGDGKADETRVVLSGFGTEDTHHILHTMRWGPGGQLYFNQSIYIHSDIETPWGPRRLDAGGIWRFRPETMQLEVFARGGINFWGHDFDRWGQSFITDGAFGEGINYGFPGAAFIAAEDAPRILHGMNPGQPKHAGLELLSGRHLPESWQGNAVTNDFRGNRTNRFVLSESGSGYASRQADDLIATDHVAFRPVDVKMGPDGAIYLADWYNPIIQHGEVDFRDPRRDKEHGRIWRITAKGRPLVEPPKLVGAPVEDLLDALTLPEGWTRNHARLQLKQRGEEEVVPALAEWIEQLSSSGSDYEHRRLEALWVYQNLDVVEEDLLLAVLQSEDHRARAAAVRVLSYWRDRISRDAGKLLEEAVTDDHPRVRLEAVNALRQQDSAEAARTALLALDREMDEYLDFALWHTVRDLEDHWLERIAEDPGFFGGNVDHLVYALRAIEKPETLAPLVDLWRAGEIPAEDEQAVLELIAGLGGPDELEIVFETALAAEGVDGENRAALLGALDRAADRREVRPAGALDRIHELLDAEDEALQAAAARLAGRWKLESARPRLIELAEGEDRDIRRAGIIGLARLGGKESREALTRLSEDPHPIDLRIQATAGLASMDEEAGARRAAAVLADGSADADFSDLFDAFLDSQSGPAALQQALSGVTLTPEIATAGLREISTSGRDLPDLARALQEAGGLEPLNQAMSKEELEELLREVKASGDPARGEVVYREQSLMCMNCHAIAGAGGAVGPDLTSIGASAPADYLVESLLDPQAKIKEGYHVTRVTKKDGGVAAGVLVRETEDVLELRDGSDNRVTVPKDEVESREIVNVSLMPPGLTATLRRDQFVDLIHFLSVLGKTGGYETPRARLVRTWRVLEGGEEVSGIIRANGVGYAAREEADLPWRPMYSRVSGELPLGDLPNVQYFAGREFSVARFELEVSDPGVVGLRFNVPDGLSMWVGRQKVDQVDQETQIDLSAGEHTITIAVDYEERRGRPLRVELTDVLESDARAEVVGGK